MRKLFTIACATITMVSCNNKNIDIEQQVDNLYNKMSQAERINQLRSGYMDDFFDTKGKLDTTKCKELIPNGIGHFSQYASQQPLDANSLRDKKYKIVVK